MTEGQWLSFWVNTVVAVWIFALYLRQERRFKRDRMEQRRLAEEAIGHPIDWPTP